MAGSNPIHVISSSFFNTTMNDRYSKPLNPNSSFRVRVPFPFCPFVSQKMKKAGVFSPALLLVVPGVGEPWRIPRRTVLSSTVKHHWQAI